MFIFKRHIALGLKNTCEQLARLPLAKHVFRNLGDWLCGPFVTFFSLNRVVKDSLVLSQGLLTNRYAIDVASLREKLCYINRFQRFVSLAEALARLKGEVPLEKSVSVLVLESPYQKTIETLKPLLCELELPVVTLLSVNSLQTGQMPWYDELAYWLQTTRKTSIQATFLDRGTELSTPNQKIASYFYLLAHLNHCQPSALRKRLTQLQECLEVFSRPDGENAVASPEFLHSLSLNSLFSFASAGFYCWPLFDISEGEASHEIMGVKNEISSLINARLEPVFFPAAGYLQTSAHHWPDLIFNAGFEACISETSGLARPGDNLFHLPMMPIHSPAGEGFEILGVKTAIDELALEPNSLGDRFF